MTQQLTVGCGIGEGVDTEALLAGPSLGLRELADHILATGEAILVLNKPLPPYDTVLHRLRVESVQGAGVEFSVDKSGLLLTGSRINLEKLAANIRRLAAYGRPGEDLHVEHVPGDAFISPNSIFLVIELLSQTDSLPTTDA